MGFFALFGIYATNALIQFYSEGPLNLLTVPLLIIGAAGAYWPLNLLANIGGATLIVLVILLSSRALKRQHGGGGIVRES